MNAVFLKALVTTEDGQTRYIGLPLDSYITYFIHQYCASTTTLQFVPTISDLNEPKIILNLENNTITTIEEIPWQVSSCVYPVVMYDDTIITGLSAVVRHICKYKTSPPSSQEHAEGILGFRKSCLQAPNETSIWTKFCEIDIIKTVNNILNIDKLEEVPVNLVRFENHLKKPVRIHNVYKIARDLKKDNTTFINTPEEKISKLIDNNRGGKNRKWKSNKNKELEIDSSMKIESLDLKHQFAEGPFLTLADLILLPSYHIIVKSIENIFESILPLSYNWYKTVMKLLDIENVKSILNCTVNKKITFDSLIQPAVDDVSLYKSDPKRHNPKKRLFTKEEDIENALMSLTDNMEIEVSKSEIDCHIEWNKIPSGASPLAGHLPDSRMIRKTQQLENLALAVMKIAKKGDLIVDFCSGSGHLGILIAHLLPKCTVILLENKEQSLLRARTRVHEMCLNNVYFYQCNLDFYIGKFDIGIALHACGIASDLVLDKCLNANAKFVLCPCCYGSLHVTDRLSYPRSNKFKTISIDQYMCIGHAADQTHEDHPLTARGSKCMAAIDSDRGRLAEEFGYKVTLSKLNPVSCTPKNNLLIGLPF